MIIGSDFAINIATKEIQTQFHSLSSCRADLDLLLEDTNLYKTEVGHGLYQCKLGNKYIGSCSEKPHIISFESGVLKIQKNVAESMSPHEKHVCAALRLDHDNANKK